MPIHRPDKICLLCEQYSEYKFLKDFENIDGKFSLYHCLSCGGQFWLPFKNPGAEWYEHSDMHNVKDELKPRQIHSYHKEFLKLHGNSIKGLKIMDLGCGTGEFMAELENKKAEVYGVDIDKDSVDIAKKFFNFKNIYNFPIDIFFQTTELPQFDYITAFEFFEHVDSPRIILSQSKKLLKPEGKLIISMPTRERIFANLSSWDYPYHHLSRWDEKSIKYILELFGYKKIKTIYINQFHQLYELCLEIIAKKLGFKKASGFKKIAKEKTLSGKNKKSIKKLFLKIIYKTGRFVGVILAPYAVAALLFPVSVLFFPRSGIMYIEASKE